MIISTIDGGEEKITGRPTSRETFAGNIMTVCRICRAASSASRASSMVTATSPVESCADMVICR